MATTTENKIQLLYGYVADLAKATTDGQLLFTIDESKNHIYFNDPVSKKQIEFYKKDLEDLQSAIEDLESGEGEGFDELKKQINDVLGTASDTSNKNTVYGAKKAAAEALAAANSKVASVTAGDGLESNGSATAPTLSVKINENSAQYLTVDEDGISFTPAAVQDYTVKVETGTTNSNASKTYEVKQGPTNNMASVGSIDIPSLAITEASGVYTITYGGQALDTKINVPKDVFLDDAELVDEDADGEEGTYIKLTFNTESGKSPIYVDVASLVDTYEANNTSKNVTVTVSDYKISANVNESGITSTELAASAVIEGKIAANAVTSGKIAADAVITEKIADKNVTAAKLADKTVTAAQIADNTITKDKLSTSLQQELGAIYWGSFSDIS